MTLRTWAELSICEVVAYGFLKCVASWKFGVTVSPTGQTVHSRMFGPNCGEDRRHSIFHSPARTPAKFYGASTGTKSYGASTSYGADQIGSCCLCSQASSASSFIFVPMFQWYDIMILILIFSQVFPPKGHKFHKPSDCGNIYLESFRTVEWKAVTGLWNWVETYYNFIIIWRLNHWIWLKQLFDIIIISNFVFADVRWCIMTSQQEAIQ